MQYIRGYPPYLEAVSFIRNPRKRHAVVTRDPLEEDNRIILKGIQSRTHKVYFLTA
jgi:hypothetical protein